MVQTEEVEKMIVILKKKVENSNEEINDLIDVEKGNFKEQKAAFDKNVEDFREDFLAKAPKEMKEFSAEEIKSSYEIMDKYYDMTIKLEEEKKRNNDMELLLKIPLSYNKQISDCLNDLKLYKTMWDHIAYLFSIFENWKVLRMKEIDSKKIE